MDKRNTTAWLRKREVASLMHIDTRAVDEYWKQGLLPGKRLFDGRIVIFRKSDVEKLIETLAQEKEHPEYSADRTQKERQ